MKHSKIIGTGSYLPEKVLTNADLEKIVDTSDEWITSRTGIKRRHVAADNETTADMGLIAAHKAIDMAGIDKSKIGMIIAATATSDDSFPSTASVIQHKLGIGHVPAFDVSAACAGFNHALSVADQYIKTGFAEYILVLGTEMLTRILDWNDRSTCVLFGDGAGAVLLGVSDEPGILSTHLGCDGAQHDALYAPNLLVQKDNRHASPYIKMNGREVFRHAVSRLGGLVEESLSACGLVQADIDWLIPHQANMRIIQAIAKRLDMPMDKVIVTLDDQGNTSAASVPLALDIAVRDGRVKRGDLILLESFGGGLVWGSAVVRF
jgi:3-oxoacyl-[acyl-carrier-protein] synthase III